MFMFTSLICYAAVLCFMVCFSTYLRFCSAGISDIRPGSGVLFMYCVWLRGLYPSRSRPRSVVRVALLFSMQAEHCLSPLCCIHQYTHAVVSHVDEMWPGTTERRWYRLHTQTERSAYSSNSVKLPGLSESVISATTQAGHIRGRQQLLVAILLRRLTHGRAVRVHFVEEGTRKRKPPLRTVLCCAQLYKRRFSSAHL